jgi:putative addiction module component (TIGR02574 family)
LQHKDLVGSLRPATDAILTSAVWTSTWPNLSPLPPPGFDDLSVDEKIDYLQSLWDRIAATPETIPVPDWHREILDERLKDLEANPDAGDSWEVVQDRAFARIREHPFQFPVIAREVRRALLHTFPYAVYFRVLDDVVAVVAVLLGERPRERPGSRPPFSTGVEVEIRPWREHAEDRRKNSARSSSPTCAPINCAEPHTAHRTPVSH